jgi:hypothetical protein
MAVGVKMKRRKENGIQMVQKQTRRLDSQAIGQEIKDGDKKPMGRWYRSS